MEMLGFSLTGPKCPHDIRQCKFKVFLRPLYAMWLQTDLEEFESWM